VLWTQENKLNAFEFSFQPSAFSLGDLCLPPMANVLKVFLENGQTKSFKYDTTTTVADVVTSLKDKLCITAIEHFSLVVEHVKSLRRNKLTLLDPNESLARVSLCYNLFVFQVFLFAKKQKDHTGAKCRHFP
jgi:hypothetical protein